MEKFTYMVKEWLIRGKVMQQIFCKWWHYSSDIRRIYMIYIYSFYLPTFEKHKSITHCYNKWLKKIILCVIKDKT